MFGQIAPDGHQGFLWQRKGAYSKKNTATGLILSNPQARLTWLIPFWTAANRIGTEKCLKWKPGKNVRWKMFQKRKKKELSEKFHLSMIHLSDDN